MDMSIPVAKKKEGRRRENDGRENEPCDSASPSAWEGLRNWSPCPVPPETGEGRNGIFISRREMVRENGVPRLFH